MTHMASPNNQKFSREMESAIEALHTASVALSNVEAKNEERLSSLEHLLRGNGHDGLVTRMSLLENGGIAKQGMELAGVRWRVIGEIVVAAAALIALALQLL